MANGYRTVCLISEDARKQLPGFFPEMCIRDRDFQSSFGKAVYGVCTRAKRANPDIRVIALCGALGAGYEQAYGWGLDGAVSIVPGACTLEEALRRGAENLRAATADVLRILTACPDNWAGQARRKREKK